MQGVAEVEVEVEPAPEVEWKREQLEVWGGIGGQHQYAYYESDTIIRLFPIE